MLNGDRNTQFGALKTRGEILEERAINDNKIMKKFFAAPFSCVLRK